MMKSNNIPTYISGFPPATQKVLKQLRAMIRKSAPKATESISYGIPAYKLDGSYLIYFAGYTHHVSLYPAPRGIEAFSEALSPYKGGKGTVQFPLDQPLPVPLINRILKFRIKETQKRKLKAR